MASADTERQTAGPLQGGNGPLGTLSDPQRMTTEAAVRTHGSKYLFQRRGGATVFSCHHILTFPAGGEVVFLIGSSRGAAAIGPDRERDEDEKQAHAPDERQPNRCSVSIVEQQSPHRIHDK